jgi:hypothetical protein
MDSHLARHVAGEREDGAHHLVAAVGGAVEHAPGIE